MPVTWKDIAFEPGPTFGDGVVQSWEWMTDRSDLKPFLCSKLGDVFCTDALGAVHWLSCSAGAIEWITPSRAIFDAECEKNGAKVDEWFGPKLIEQLHSENKVAGPGEAYMFVTLPIFEECTYTPDNFNVAPANEIFVGMAETLKLYQDLPNKTRVRMVIYN